MDDTCILESLDTRIVFRGMWRPPMKVFNLDTLSLPRTATEVEEPCGKDPIRILLVVNLSNHQAFRLVTAWALLSTFGP